MPITLEQRPEISEGDVERPEIDYSGWLGSDEELTGTPTAVEIGSTDLTISGVGLSTTTLSILGEDVPAHKAVVFMLSGQKSGKRYTVRLTATSNSSPARTCVRDIVLTVR